MFGAAANGAKRRHVCVRGAQRIYLVALVGLTLSGACRHDRERPDTAPSATNPGATRAVPNHGATPPTTQPSATEAKSAPNTYPSAPLRIAHDRGPGVLAWSRIAQPATSDANGPKLQLESFDQHAAALEAYSAGHVDAVVANNSDMLLNRNLGSPCTAIAVISRETNVGVLYARSKIEDVTALTGKTIGVELGYPEHLALEQALAAVGIAPGAVQLVNVVPEVAHREFGSRALDAVMLPAAFAESFTKRTKDLHSIYDGATAAPLLFQVLCVRASSLAARRGEWTALAKISSGKVFTSPTRANTPSPPVRPLGVDASNTPLRNAMVAATSLFDEFYVRTHLYRTPLLSAFERNDLDLL